MDDRVWFQFCKKKHRERERRIWKDTHQNVISSFSGRVGFFVFLSYPFFLFTVTKAKTKETKKKSFGVKRGYPFTNSALFTHEFTVISMPE